jgi:wyosine [tRNA(Phe)-imidazoG37] synthetase (radical SAM superfamily)
MDWKIFGLVPSRRLGKSLGVNNILHKICTYSSLYCQIGKATKMPGKQAGFYEPEELVEEAKTVLQNIRNAYEYPGIAYIAIPTRPPVFKEVLPAKEATVNEAYHIFKEFIEDVELLNGYEGNAFSST